MNERLITHGAREAPVPESQEWWASLSGDELHDILKRGLAAGDLFFAATAEAKRREREIAERSDFLASLENVFAGKSDVIFRYVALIVAIIAIGFIADTIGR